MRYSLVPVPAEHVLEIMRWLLFRAPDQEVGAEKQTDDHLRLFLDQADEATKALLHLIADATLEDRPLRLNDAADDLDQDRATVQSNLREANATALGDGRPLVRIAAEIAVGVHSNRGKVSFLSMRPHHAKVVRGALRPADVASD